MVSSTKDIPKEPGPAWEIARLYPDQGHWSEEEYLSVTEASNWLVEFTDGHIEVLTMPTTSHQLIVQYIQGLLLAFVTAKSLGTVLFAPLRVRLRKGVIREPDIVFMLKEHASRMKQDAWEGADLVMEVVSDDAASRERDLVKKRSEYARAGIPEYWIVDPAERRVTVLKLEGKKYVVDGEYGEGETAKSATLEGFGADVGQIWKAGKI